MPLPPITRDRYYEQEPYTKIKPVFLTGCHNVWTTFEEAEQHLLAYFRSSFSENQNHVNSQDIYMVYPGLSTKFRFTYWARCKVKRGHIYLEIERSPGVNVKTQNYLAGTEEVTWTEKLKLNTKIKGT